MGIGNAYIRCIDTGEKRLLKNALHVLDLGINIISQAKIANHIAIIIPNNLYIIDNTTSKILTIGEKVNNLYYLPIKIVKPLEKAYKTNKQRKGLNKPYNLNISENTLITTSPIYNETVSLETIHKRMGHINLKAIKKLNNNTIGLTIINSTNFDINKCEDYNEAKMISQRYKIPLNNIKSLDYLEKVASDIYSPIKPTTYDGYKYFITFIDKKTYYLEVYLLKHKSEALKVFNNFRLRAEKQSEKKVRILAIDNGKEYINDNFARTLSELGILHQKSPPYTKEPNGLIERINRTILNKVRTIIYTAKLPRYLWEEAVLASIYTYNKTPYSSLKDYIIPYEAKNGLKPILNNIRVFGSLCYYKVNSPLHKLDKKARKGVIIGFGKEANIYKVFDILNKKAI